MTRSARRYERASPRSRGLTRPDERDEWRALVIECQAQELQRQGLHVGSMVASLSQIVGQVVRLEVGNADQLPLQFRSLGGRHFYAVTLVGHSNEDGVRLASDLFVTWSQLGEMLEGLHVRKLLLLACRGGLPAGCRALFDAVPTLVRIYACPDLLAFSQAMPVGVLAPLVLSEDDLPDETRTLLQMLHLFANDGLFFELRREDFRTANGRQTVHSNTALALLAKLLLTED